MKSHNVRVRSLDHIGCRNIFTIGSVFDYMDTNLNKANNVYYQIFLVAKRDTKYRKDKKFYDVFF